MSPQDVVKFSKFNILPIGKAKGVIFCDFLNSLYVCPVLDEKHWSLMGKVNTNTHVYCISTSFIVSYVIIQISGR